MLLVLNLKLLSTVTPDLQILTNNIHVLHKVAQNLMERESLDHLEFAELVDEAGPIAPKGLSWMGV